MIAIEKNVPMPTVRPSQMSGAMDALKAMEVGDSILVRGAGLRNSVGQYVTRAQRITGAKFTRRATDEGFRIWRTA